MSKNIKLKKEIFSLLPGTDCGGFGGCGYSTCESCAEAIADGGAVEMCPACNSETVAQIAEVTGRQAVSVEEKIAFIRCAGHAAGKERLRNFSSCEEAKKSGFIKNECQWGCLGIGSCIDRCKFEAMTLEDGNIKIDEEKCTGCRACLDICPQHIITMIPKDATNFIPCASQNNEQETLDICGYGCIGCGDCALACPEDAISMVYEDKIDGRYASIDYDKCVGCVTCTASCRKKIIVDTYHDLTKIKEQVAFVKCTGGAAAVRLRTLGIEDCADTAKLDFTAMGLCQYGCTGLGSCTKVCRYNAISIQGNSAYVNPEKCVGCGDCIRECPRNMIEMADYKGVKQMACSSKGDREERIKVCETGCIGCGDCADNCPNNAISMTFGYPEVDSSLCENCGICTYVCTRNVIKERQVSEYNYIQVEAMKIDKTSDERKW